MAVCRDRRTVRTVSELSPAAPFRVRRRRTREWRMPENTVYVGRPTRWGNPHTGGTHTSMVERFSESLHSGQLGFTVADVRRELAREEPGRAGVEIHCRAMLTCSWQSPTQSTLHNFCRANRGQLLGSVDISRHSRESGNPGAFGSRHRARSGFRPSPE